MQRPFQVPLRAIFWVMAAVGVGCAVVPVIEPVLGCLVLALYVVAGMWFAFRPYEKLMEENPYQAPLEGGDPPKFTIGPKRSVTLLELLVCAVIIGVLIALLSPARQRTRHRRWPSPPANVQQTNQAPPPGPANDPAGVKTAPDEILSPPPAIR